jgi:hypothetical protein
MSRAGKLQRKTRLQGFLRRVTRKTARVARWCSLKSQGLAKVYVVTIAA